MKFVSWTAGLGFRLVGAGLVLALAILYGGFHFMRSEDGMFLIFAGKIVFLAGIICLWLTIIVSDLGPKNAG